MIHHPGSIRYEAQPVLYYNIHHPGSIRKEAQPVLNLSGELNHRRACAPVVLKSDARGVRKGILRSYKDDDAETRHNQYSTCTTITHEFRLTTHLQASPGPIALGHPKISIFAWETAQKHPRGLSPRSFSGGLMRSFAFPLRCGHR